MSAQLNKKYGSDHVKSKSRSLVKEVIENTLLTYKKPENLRVLCFPGRDAAEITEIYDVLGIPRENIIGVERDGKVADYLDSQKLGIQIVNKELSDYVNSDESPRNLSIISLDYTSPLKEDHLKDIRKLLNNSYMNQMVIHTANSAKRDRGSFELYSKGFLRDCVPEEKDRSLEEMLKGSDSYTKKILNEHGEYEESQERIRNGNVSEDDRSKAYTNMLRLHLGGTNMEDLTNLLNFSLEQKGFSEIIKNVRKAYKLESSNQSDKEIITNTLKSSEKFLRAVEGSVFYSIRDLLENTFRQNMGQIVRPIYLALQEASNTHKSFKIADSKTYRYISESGCPMIGDINYIIHTERLKERAANLAHQLGWPNKLELKNKNNFLKNMQDFVKEFKKVSEKYGLKNPDYNRIHLGSSSKPVLNRRRALEAFKKGMTNEEIKSQFRGWKNKPISQWRAHHTMGTYNTKENKQSTQVANPSQLETIITTSESSPDNLTREQAEDLLNSGISPKEISEAYSTFTAGQLRAFKAWQTIRKKKKNKD